VRKRCSASKVARLRSGLGAQRSCGEQRGMTLHPVRH
jgi:hypothetical protein